MAETHLISIQNVGDQFVDHYNAIFDEKENPNTGKPYKRTVDLLSLYREGSLMTFQGERCPTMADISTKLNNLTFSAVHHETSSKTAQPTPNGGILILVTGALVVDGNAEQPLNYAQSFQLLQDPTTGQWVVSNDVFSILGV